MVILSTPTLIGHQSVWSAFNHAYFVIVGGYYRHLVHRVGL